jgi:structure-specific recognition protein 1
VARGYQLRIGLNRDRTDIKLGDRRRESFDGFRPEVSGYVETDILGLSDQLNLVIFSLQDQEKLSNIFKQHFHVTLETKDLSLRGWNWGKVDVQGK